MRNLAAAFLSMLLTVTLGCGVGVGEYPEAQGTSALTSTENNALAQQSAGHDEVLTSNPIASSERIVDTDPTTEEHNGKWCTYDCRDGCHQNIATTWGHCTQRASALGCVNARWCSPLVCCR